MLPDSEAASDGAAIRASLIAQGVLIPAKKRRPIPLRRKYKRLELDARGLAAAKRDGERGRGAACG